MALGEPQPRRVVRAVGRRVGPLVPHVGRRSRRQEPGGKEVPFTRGEQPGAAEDVDVLVNQAADPHHQVVVDPDALLGGARCDEVLDALRRNGLFDLLGGDGELTRAVAAIGLANTVSTDIGVVRMLARLLEVDEEALEQALTLESAGGMPLVACRGERVLALV